MGKKYRRRKRIKQIKRIVLLLFCIFSGVIVFLVGMCFIKREKDAVSGNIQTETNKADTTLEWNLLLVNKDHVIPDDYEMNLIELSNGEKVDERIYPQLQQMFDEARASGLELFVREGFRTQEEQQKIMDERIRRHQAEGYSKRKAEKLAKEYVAIPGTSEHQLGLSVDINADTSRCSSDAVYEWLDENAYLYGFIKRYPSDKTKITGINNEPWHYRYVGKEAAKKMKEKKMCLEEYLEQLEE